ncbi:MFS transporter [Chondromyces crocatus]|nr:MFS transporter [Chondromyces crocatus]
MTSSLPEPAVRTRASTREIFGWAMFDFANSSYTTVIITVVFSVIFPKIIVGDAPTYRQGNLFWSVALSVSYGLVVLTAPWLGALMDFRAAKKRFLLASCLVTVAATAALYWATPGRVGLAMILLIVSNYGFAVGESFAAAFLPDLGPKEALGRISGYAWGLGYLGGLVSTALVVFTVGPQEPDNLAQLRWVGPMTAVFFLLAALPTFAFLKERGTPQALPAGESLARLGFARLRTTIRELHAFEDLVWFFGGLFFATAGLSIVISFAFIYGDQVVRWQPRSQLLMFVLTNLSAAGGAVLFGALQDRWGNLKTYRLTLLIWGLAVVGIHQTKTLAAIIGKAVGGAWAAEDVYLLVGTLAGLCLGATQSAGRTVVAVFAPASRSGELFGLWGVCGKLASIVGLLSLGLLQSALGLERAILVCGGFFFAAWLLSLKVDERRGMATARRHEGA